MLLENVATLAKHNNWQLWCKARQNAVGFYKACGWNVVGEAFDIPGIGQHYKMELKLESSI